eukprot:COSAG06_NODE_11192_length_1548_cov_1.953071_2_plen_67_part_01
MYYTHRGVEVTLAAFRAVRALLAVVEAGCHLDHTLGCVWVSTRHAVVTRWARIAVAACMSRGARLTT